MKKILTLLAFFSLGVAGAQEISDALRYAQDNLTGTARFRAMSGAFGALGGDLSSINVNPAGSAVFANNQVGLTLSSFNTKNESRYFGTNSSESDNTFNLNQAGGVFIFENKKEGDWRKVSLALNYENTANFENTLFSYGTNPTQSVASYFLHYANAGGVTLNTLENSNYEQLDFGAAQALLGYQGYVINPVQDTPNNVAYVSNVPAGGNFYHEQSLISTGFNGKLSFNGAASYKDRIYFGVNLNSHFTDYRLSTSFLERNGNDPATGLQRVRFNNDLYTTGSGFSFQIGSIVKVTPEFRAGLAYESPTWYRLTDELTQSISSVTAENAGVNVYDPAITVIYAPYKIQTPGKWTGSMAYIIGKKGLISLDYAIKDYSSTQFRPQNSFVGTNAAMENLLNTAAEIRIGAEHRIKQWSLRAGYRHEQSPYKDGKTIGDLNGYSGGVGYNFGTTKLDFAYSRAERQYDNAFFSRGLTSASRVTNINDIITLTLLFEL
jgi:hypothetical protein